MIERFCTGGPGGRYCGEVAEVVCTDARGLKWYACPKHTEGAKTEPIAAFVARFDNALELEAAIEKEQELVRRFILRGIPVRPVPAAHRATQAAVDCALAAAEAGAETKAPLGPDPRQLEIPGSVRPPKGS